jgi:hypothetical protein
MDIGKLAAPKGDGQNQKVEGTRSKKPAGEVAAMHGEKVQGTHQADSVQISGKARNLGHVVQSLVSQLHDMDSSELDAEEVQDYRDRLAGGDLSTPEILDATATRLLQGLEGEIASFPSLEQRGI